MLGASFDSPAENLAFRAKFGFPYDLLCDEDRAMGLAYGVADSAETVYPARASFLIDEAGVIERVYPKVDPTTHPDEVLTHLATPT